MKEHSPIFLPAALVLLLAATMPVSWAQEEFDETKAFIEMNATDGDVGFHVLLDAEAWKEVRIDDPDGKKIFHEQAKGNLMEQGLTENFFESTELPCEAEFGVGDVDGYDLLRPAQLRAENGVESRLRRHRLVTARVQLDGLEAVAVAHEAGDGRAVQGHAEAAPVIAEYDRIVSARALVALSDEALGCVETCR